ncbi:MarR family winged helix-turn-helix transcriptional regulator [Sphaerisporangium aureirubrum]|uniref:MarR family winged helix-turn-helix transcriptional regulator n=1 Tax=Sphaerisporangium aureirubrum TaxID=1544736 RepID=A0ABW1NDM5_9ACTN
MVAGYTQTPRTLDRLGLLLAHHGAHTNARIRQALTATGLPLRHAVALMHLSEGPMGQQALIETLAVDPSVLVSILNDLERDGLAVRRRDPADRRRHIVEVTPLGCTTMAEVDLAFSVVESEIFAGLDSDDLAALRRILDRMKEGTDAAPCTAAD